MEKYRINIDKVIEIKDLYDAGSIFTDIKNEIVLETSELDFNPIRLRATLAILCEGILNAKPKSRHYEVQNIDYTTIDIPDLDTLAKELTRLTGVKFSAGLVM